jgi:hypothetical protein
VRPICHGANLLASCSLRCLTRCLYGTTSCIDVPCATLRGLRAACMQVSAPNAVSPCPPLPGSASPRWSGTPLPCTCTRSGPSRSLHAASEASGAYTRTPVHLEWQRSAPTLTPSLHSLSRCAIPAASSRNCELHRRPGRPSVRAMPSECGGEAHHDYVVPREAQGTSSAACSSSPGLRCGGCCHLPNMESGRARRDSPRAALVRVVKQMARALDSLPLALGQRLAPARPYMRTAVPPLAIQSRSGHCLSNAGFQPRMIVESPSL